MELSDNGDELPRAAILCHDLPEALSADSVKRLGQIDVGGEQVGVLFLALLLELSCRKHHVDCSTFFPEATLTLGKEILLQVSYQAVEEDSGECLACDREEGNPTMVVTSLSDSLSLVEVDDGCVLNSYQFAPLVFVTYVIITGKKNLKNAWL